MTKKSEPLLCKRLIRIKPAKSIAKEVFLEKILLDGKRNEDKFPRHRFSQ